MARINNRSISPRCARCCSKAIAWIVRFGGCDVFRLREARFEPLSDGAESGEIQAARLGDREEASRALSIHDVEAGPNDHWLLGTSGLPPRLSEEDSRRVIEAWDQNQRTAHKPIVAVGGTDGRRRHQRRDCRVGVGVITESGRGRASAARRRRSSCRSRSSRADGASSDRRDERSNSGFATCQDS